MKHIPKALAPGQEDSSGERDLLLSALRTATARSELAANAFKTVGISLRQRAINCEEALAWLKDENLLGWVHLGPPKT